MSKLENKKLKKTCKWLLKCFVGAAILWYLFHKIPINQVIVALVNIKASYLAPALLLQITMRYIIASQLQIFLRQQKIDFSALQLMKINLQAQFYALLLPGELSGGLVRWHKLSKQNRMRAQTAVCIVLSRTISTLCLAALGIVFFLIEMPYHSSLIGMSLSIGLVVFILLFLVIINAGIFAKVENIVNKLNLCKVPKLLREKMGKIWNAVKCFHKLSLIALNYAFFLSLLYHLAGIFSVYLLMQALGINISIVSIVWIRAAVVFVQMLPISVSGLGVREGTFVFLLGRYSIAPANAMALSFIIFGIMVTLALIGGVLEFQESFFNSKREL